MGPCEVCVFMWLFFSIPPTQVTTVRSGPMPRLSLTSCKMGINTCHLRNLLWVVMEEWGWEGLQSSGLPELRGGENCLPGGSLISRLLWLYPLLNTFRRMAGPAFSLQGGGCVLPIVKQLFRKVGKTISKADFVLELVIGSKRAFFWTSEGCTGSANSLDEHSCRRKEGQGVLQCLEAWATKHVASKARGATWAWTMPLFLP